MDIKSIVINKNRGWRGLAEIRLYNEDKELISKTIFSFSQEMWDDLIIAHMITIASEDYYYVIYFNDPKDRLPRPEQQRSVLIKNFTANVREVNKIKKTEWASAEAVPWSAIRHFRNNRNNHTTSDWNYIGLRVIPKI